MSKELEMYAGIGKVSGMKESVIPARDTKSRMKEGFVLYKMQVLPLLDNYQDKDLGALFRALVEWQTGEPGEVVKVPSKIDRVFQRLLLQFCKDDDIYRDKCTKSRKSGLLREYPELREHPDVMTEILESDEEPADIIKRSGILIADDSERYQALANDSERYQALAYRNRNRNKSRNKSRSKNREEEEPELLLPFSSDRFLSLWDDLLAMPNWADKPHSVLQEELYGLKQYDEDFACRQISDAISGGWSRLTFPETAEKYKHYKSAAGEEPRLVVVKDLEDLLR